MSGHFPLFDLAGPSSSQPALVTEGDVGSVDGVGWPHPSSERVGWWLILTALMSPTIWDHKIWCRPTRSQMVSEKRWKVFKKSDLHDLPSPTTSTMGDWRKKNSVIIVEDIKPERIEKESGRSLKRWTQAARSKMYMGLRRGSPTF